MPLSTPRRLGRSSSELRGSAGDVGAGDVGDAAEIDALGGDSMPARTGGSGNSPQRHDWDDLSPCRPASSTSVSDCTGVPLREPLLHHNNKIRTTVAILLQNDYQRRSLASYECKSGNMPDA